MASTITTVTLAPHVIPLAMKKLDQATRAALLRSHEYEKGIVVLEQKLSEEVNITRGLLNEAVEARRQVERHELLVEEASIIIPQIISSSQDIGDGYQAVANQARDVKDAIKMLQEGYGVTRLQIEQLMRELHWLDTHWRERHWSILKGDAPVSGTATLYFRILAFVVVVILPLTSVLVYAFRGWLFGAGSGH